MNLIIQANHTIPANLLNQLAGLTLPIRTEQIGAHAFRLHEARPHDSIAGFCFEHQLDYAFVDARSSLSNFGLVVMDMDSTLINIECIDEIADMQGLKPQVSEITEAAMRGEIDFAESLTRRVALLAGLDESALQRVYDERLQLNPGAELMLGELKRHGIKTLLVSGGFTFFTDRLKDRLGLDYAESNTLEIIDGKLTGKVLGTIVDAQGKADHLNRIRSQFNLHPQQVVAIGDGANDLKMMAEAGTSIAYHAKPVVRARASHALNFTGLDGVLPLLGH